MDLHQPVERERREQPGARRWWLVVVLLWALPAGAAEEQVRYVFAWRGVPVGTVTLGHEAGRFTYTSLHLHRREGRVGERVREVVLRLGAQGRVEGSSAVPQALWLWKGPRAPGCTQAREELSGREGLHCITAVRGAWVEGTLLGQPFRARQGRGGRMELLEVGESRFTVVAPGVRLRPPPELLSRGLPVEGGRGALAFEPPWPVAARPGWLTEWSAEEARALAEQVHASFPRKGPGAADWEAQEGSEAGGCLAHALRFAARAAARGQRVALVHGLVVEEGMALPHAWVRVGLAGGGTLDVDPALLEPVRPERHLALALAEPGREPVEAGVRWLALLRAERRVVRRAPAGGGRR